MVLAPKYELNIDRLKQVIGTAFVKAQAKYCEHKKEPELALIRRFFDAKKYLKIKVKYQSQIPPDELPVIVINYGDTDFDGFVHATGRQTSTTIYYVDFITSGDSDTCSIDIATLAARVAREALLDTPPVFFEWEEITLEKITEPQVNTAVSNNISGRRLVVRIECLEEKTDFDDDEISGANSIETAITADDGLYKILQEG